MVAATLAQKLAAKHVEHVARAPGVQLHAPIEGADDQKGQQEVDERRGVEE